jgi:signal transduction histidine kinase
VTRKDIEWITRLDPRAPRIEADAAQIHQVLTNLVLNACSAMQNDGQLTIETVSVCIGENPPAARRMAVAGHYALLAVSDTGAGIKENGSLSIVRRIVTEAGGWTQVHSEPGQGSRFEVYLPQIS